MAYTHVTVLSPVTFSVDQRGAHLWLALGSAGLSVHIDATDPASLAEQLRAAADVLEASLIPTVVEQATEIVNGLAEVDCG